jgi:hypothetical protein
MAIDGYNIRAKAACKEQLSMYLYGYKNIAELNKFNRLTLFWEELLLKGGRQGSMIWQMFWVPSIGLAEDKERPWPMARAFPVERGLWDSSRSDRR